MQNKEQYYRFEGLLPMTKEQIISYMKNGNHLTKRRGKFFLTGGIPVYSEKKGVQTVKRVLQREYSGYEEYFDSLAKEGLITKAFG